jgi:ketosteroid isomerase-like protein
LRGLGCPEERKEDPVSDTVEQRLQELEKEVRVLRDREEIREVIYRYCRAVDRCDVEMMKSCYHPDSFDTHWFYNGPGHGFCEYVIPVLQAAEASEHLVANTMIELDGDRAFVESRWNVLHRIPLQPGQELAQLGHGRYLDIFERREGEWKIRYRHVAIDGFREFELPHAEAMMPPALLGKQDRTDPVYLGFDLEQLRGEPTETEDFWGPFLAAHGVGDTSDDPGWLTTDAG